MTKIGFRNRVLWFAVVFLVALGAAGLGTGAYLSWRVGTALEEEPTSWPGLLSNTRANVAVCVDDLDWEGQEEQLAVQVSQALDQASTDKRFSQLYPAVRTVSHGCPESPVEIGSLASVQDLATAATRLRGVGQPSPYRLYVYSLDEAQYAETFEGESFFLTTAEYDCHEHVCGAVTYALYVPRASPGTGLTDGVLSALGLGPIPVDPTYAPGEAERLRDEALTDPEDQ